MEDRRIFVVGDIHGCYAQLETMLARLDWRPENGELLIFLGDYIDRGPESFAVVETVAQMAQKFPAEVIPLMGNHEAMFLEYLGGSTAPYLFHNGLGATLASYRRAGAELPAGIPDGHRRFFRRLRLSYETEEYIFVHAGLRPGRPLAGQEPNDLLWIREPFLSSDYDFGRTVVYGHTPRMDGPITEPGRLGLDTGAVYGGPLSAAVLPAGDFILV